jgi:hypothetical protein
MQKSPSEKLIINYLVKKFPALEPKDHYCVQKVLPLDPIPSKMNPVPITSPYSFKACFNTILTSTPMSPKLSVRIMCEHNSEK